MRQSHSDPSIFFSLNSTTDSTPIRTDHLQPNADQLWRQATPGQTPSSNPDSTTTRTRTISCSAANSKNAACHRTGIRPHNNRQNQLLVSDVLKQSKRPCHCSGTSSEDSICFWRIHARVPATMKRESPFMNKVPKNILSSSFDRTYNCQINHFKLKTTTYRYKK